MAQRYYTLPDWQEGVATPANGASGSFRNFPDVAMVADECYVLSNNGVQQEVGGTSLAAPLWAGIAALVNQQAAANGNPPAGFLNPAIYAIGQSAHYQNCFHDITVGSNTNWCSIVNGIYGFYAVAGYDLCTGWGTPNGFPLIRQLAGPLTPVGWWRAQGNTADHMCTLGYPCCGAGVADGNLAYATGEVGTAFSFNGTAANVEVPSSATLDVGTAGGFTIELWVYPTDVSEMEPLVEWNDWTTFGLHMWLAVPLAGGGSGSLYGNLVDSNGNSNWFSSAPGVVAANTWQHVAMTYDKTLGWAYLYRNGAVVASLNPGPNITAKTTANAFFGYRPAPTAWFFTGMLDEISIYNTALSQTAIQGIYMCGSAGKLPPVAQ